MAVPLSSPGSFVWHYVRQRRIQFGALLLVSATAATCAIAIQYQMKSMVDAMSSAAILGAIRRPLIFFVTLMGVESLLWRLCAWQSCRTTIEVGVTMRLDLFDHLSGQSMRYFADNLAGSLGQRITGTAGSLGALSNTIMWRIVPPVIDFFGALLIFTFLAWPMAAALGVFVSIATSALIVAGYKGRPVHSQYFSQASAAVGSIVDVIANMWAVKAFSAQRRESVRLARQFSNEAIAQRRSWMYTEKSRIWYDLGLWGMSAGMTYWAVRLWNLHELTPGDVVLVIALSFRILHGSRDVALALVDVSQHVGYIEETLRVIGQVHAIRDAPFSSHSLPGRGKISFRGVTFAYGLGRPVLSNVSLEIEPGQKVGIVGASGAGKTTILQLLQRLYETQSGLICIDGIPLGTISQDNLRAVLAVVPQDISLFHRSILENIRFARPEATDAEVLAAASAACCDEFLARLPEGCHTIVGERGIKLSGGQRQRVGIARAFLKDAPILLLDEATSALDTASEIEIHHAITRLTSDRTVMAVAHRLSTLTTFDRILVLDHGKVAEDGSPEHLLKSGRLFNEMWRLQSGAAATPARVAARRVG